jgi:hypothetical protein
MSEDATHPWERLPTESAQAWEAFRKYRDLGQTRSLSQVARDLGKSRPLMAKWSSTHRWVQRAEQFDREDDRLFALQQREQRKAVARRHLRLATMAQNKVIQALQDLDVRALKPQDLIRWLEVTAKIERDALGMGQDHTVTLTTGDGALAHVVLLTDEERRARILALQREAQTRASQWADDEADAERARADA